MSVIVRHSFACLTYLWSAAEEKHKTDAHDAGKDHHRVYLSTTGFRIAQHVAQPSGHLPSLIDNHAIDNPAVNQGPDAAEEGHDPFVEQAEIQFVPVPLIEREEVESLGILRNRGIEIH